MGEKSGLVPEPAARAPRRQPALARPGGGALAPPQPVAHFPRQGAGVEPGRFPALRASPPPPPPTARQLSSAQTGGGGCLLHNPRPSSAAELVCGPREAGFLAAGAWRCRRAPGRGCWGDRGRGAAARLRALPSFFGEAPRSRRRGDPHPRGVTVGEGVLGRRLAGGLRCPAAPCPRAAPTTSARLSGSLLRTPHRVH